MNRSSKYREKLTQDELDFLSSHEVNGAQACPDCQVGPLTDGPCGGLSINMYCLNPDCGSRFNDMGPFGWERISDRSPNAPEQEEQMPVMLGYQVVAEAVFKSEEQVREDRKNKLFDLDSLVSVSEYVAKSRGWLAPVEADALRGEIAAAKAATIDRQRVGTSTVKDNQVRTDDPYLDRVVEKRNGQR